MRSLLVRLSVLGLALVPPSLAVHTDTSNTRIDEQSPTPDMREQPRNPECDAVATSPADVSLNLSLNHGQMVFREGELIDLAAEYKARVPKKYIIGPTREGIMALPGVEAFCITPNIGRNPFDGFKGAMGGWGLGSAGGSFGSAEGPMGFASGQPLGLKPYAVNLELNGWRVLPPGTYKLTLASKRIFALTNNNQLPPRDNMLPFGGKPIGGRPITLRSNTVEFQVVKADPEWQATQFSVLKRVLDAPDSTYEEKKHAVHVMRFLDTEASTRELARPFWSTEQPFGWDMLLGLFCSDHRAVAIQEMRAALKDPQHPVTKDFVELLAALEMQIEPKYRLPERETMSKEDWQKIYDADWAELQRRIAEYMAVAASALETKGGAAQAVSASELLVSTPDATPEMKAQWRRQLISSWDSLSVQQQNDLLNMHWEQIEGSEWLPVLQRIVAGEPHPYPHPSDPDRSAALLRTYELSPALGRALILKEIVAGRGDIDVNVLAMLPDRELPEIDQELVAKIKGEGKFTDYPMVERYASARMLPQVQAAYAAAAGRWACSLQTSFLRYFLRVSSDYGVKQAAYALHQRRETRCYTTELSQLGRFIRIPQLEQVTASALEDRDLDVARDAALALQSFGSPNAEAALWARLERLHSKWEGAPDKFLDAHTGMLKDQADRDREASLVQAIINGQAWFATEERLRRVEELSSPSERNVVASIRQQMQSREFAIGMNFWPAGVFSFRIAWYDGVGIAAFKEKLAEFPAGTHFKMAGNKADQDAHSVEFAAASQVTASRGQALQIEVR